MHKLRDEIENDLGADVDDSGFYESMGPQDVKGADSTSPPPNSPDKFLKRRSLISEMPSSDMLETPCTSGLDNSGSFDIPGDMDDAQKHELADLLLQIQQLELRHFPALSHAAVLAFCIELCTMCCSGSQSPPWTMQAPSCVLYRYRFFDVVFCWPQ